MPYQRYRDAFGIALLDTLKGKPFDLVILDMQGKNEKDEGKIAVRDLIQIDPRVRAVLHSSRVVQLGEEELGAFGFIGGVEKAQPTQVLLSAIRSFLCA